MKIQLASYFKNPNMGLYGVVTENYCMLPLAAPERLREEFEAVLKVPVFTSNIAGTDLLGALCIGHKQKLLVPEIVFESELKALNKLPIEVEVFNTDQTALGNNIAVAKGIAVAGHNYSDEELKILEKMLKAKVYKRSVLMLNTLGSLMALTKKGGIVHPDMSDKELKSLSELFKLKLVRATVNQGNPYVAIGVLANSKGVLVGELTRGAELTDIQEGFGVIKNG